MNAHYVRFESKADETPTLINVRFTPDNGHKSVGCPLWGVKRTFQGWCRKLWVGETAAMHAGPTRTQYFCTKIDRDAAVWTKIEIDRAFAIVVVASLSGHEYKWA